MAWYHKLGNALGLRRAAAGPDLVNVALVDAYTSLSYREREYMIGRLRDSALGIQRRPIQIDTRWQPRDRDELMAECESGLFMRLGIFLDALDADGLVDGLLDTRTSGMMRRPRIFSGDPFLCEQLKGRPVVREPATGAIVDPGKPGIYDQLCPAAEFAAVVRDGIKAGIGLGELVDGQNGLPALRHLDLHWLRYEYTTERLIYMAPGGTYEIRPGDGRWVVFHPKSSRRWWKHGKWFPLVMPVITRAGAELDRLRWLGTLADALRGVEMGAGSTDRDRNRVLQWIKEKWRRSPAFVGSRPGEKAYIVESNGRGYEAFGEAEESAATRIKFTLTGNEASSGEGKGGIGASVDGFFDIADGVNQETADAAAQCAQTCIIGPWARRFWGATDPRAVTVAYDVSSPRARQAAFEALTACAQTVTALDTMAAPRGEEVDLEAFEAEHKIRLPMRPRGGAPPALAEGPGGGAEPDEPQEDHAARLAAEMTQHGVTSCEHGRSNRCPLCGIERERAVVPGVDGAAAGWKLAWRPIGRVPV